MNKPNDKSMIVPILIAFASLFTAQFLPYEYALKCSGGMLIVAALLFVRAGIKD